jgi:hypothetical protein
VEGMGWAVVRRGRDGGAVVSIDLGFLFSFVVYFFRRRGEVRWVRGLGFGRQAGEVWIRGRGRCMRAPRGVCRRSDRAVAESGPDTTSFRKVTQEIFSELDETKPEVPIFPRHEMESKEESEGSQGQPHHLVARVTPRARHPMVWGPWPPSNIAPSPI